MRLLKPQLKKSITLAMILQSQLKLKMSTTPVVGNRVTYGKYAGQKVTVNGVRFLLLNDDELTSILPDDVEITSYVAT